MIGLKLSVFCLYALRVVGPVLINASYFDDALVKPTLLVCTVLVILQPPIVDWNFVADPNHPQYNRVGCVLFVHDNNYERLCDDMHLVGQEIFPDPDNIFSVTLFSGFDLNYENPKQTAIPKWSQYYEWKALENVSVDEDGCFYHKDDTGKKVKMGSCPMPKYNGGPVPNPYCMRNAGINRVPVSQKSRDLYPYCASSSATQGTNTGFANGPNVEVNPYPIAVDGFLSLGTTALTDIAWSEAMDAGMVVKRNPKQRKNMEE